VKLRAAYGSFLVKQERLMGMIQRRFGEFVIDEDGPAAVEYAVMLALIVAVCIGAVSSLGLKTRDVCDAICAAIGT
jgi:pilus assembly protein Flp/PilA